MKIRELATGLLFPEGPVAMDDGSVLLVEIARGTLTRVTADGRVQVVADLGGGPNGAAIGPDARSTSATTAASSGRVTRAITCDPSVRHTTTRAGASSAST